MQGLVRTVAGAAGRAGAAVVVAVVQPQGQEAVPLPEDRIAGLCHNAALDPRYALGIYLLIYARSTVRLVLFFRLLHRFLCNFPPCNNMPPDITTTRHAPLRWVVPIVPRASETDAGRAVREASLRNLGARVHEQCTAVYSRLAARAAARLALRQAPLPVSDLPPAPGARGREAPGGRAVEFSIRCAFKVSAYDTSEHDPRIKTWEAVMSPQLCPDAHPMPGMEVSLGAWPDDDIVSVKYT